MNAISSTVVAPKQLIGLLRDHLGLWLVPTIIVAAGATAYAIFSQASWEASQALIVRNEASTAQKAPGKFAYPEEMKTVQETLLELAKSRGVLLAALREIGPPANSKASETWPTERDIVETRKHIKLAPPKGAEFGKTEVFYLHVRAEDRVRSIALNEAIVGQLQLQFQKLRDEKAQSMIDELTKAAALARADLESATAKLSQIENRVGSDLAELRAMQDVASSDSALRRSGEEIRAQLRETAAAENVQQELLVALEKAQDEPGRFVATPNRLVDTHPSLRRLKDGLVDAQIRTSALQGTMSADHPRVLSAKEAEEAIGRNLHNELLIARRSAEVELRVLAERRKLLESQLAKTNERLQGLAAVRANYTNEVAEAKSRATLLERAEQNLAEAHAARASAKAASLISRIDAPDTGIYPVGPGRLAIALSGVFGGLMTGFGIVFLTVPGPAAVPVPPPFIVAARTVCPAVAYSDTRKFVSRNSEHLSIHNALHKLAK